MELLRIEELSFAYGEDASSPPVLKDINFVAGPAEFVSVVGPSGCGKTTLLKLIAGLLEPSRGAVWWNPKLNGDVPDIGYVFQSPNLLPWLTAIDNVELPLRLGAKVARTEPRALMEKLGLKGYERVYPWQLSLGMQMRLNLGRALIGEPSVLLLDEPFAALDAPTANRLQDDILNVASDRNLLVIYVTHNLVDALMLSSRIVVLSGRPATVQAIYELSEGLKRRRSYPEYLLQELLDAMQGETSRRLP